MHCTYFIATMHLPKLPTSINCSNSYANRLIIFKCVTKEAVPAVGATGRDGAESRLPVLALDHGLALLARGRQVPQPHRGIVRARQEFLLDLWMPVAGVDLQGREGYNYFFINFFGFQIFSPTCAVWPLLRVWSSTYWSPLRHSSITPPSRSRTLTR